MKKHKIIFALVLAFIIILAILGGWYVGNLISAKYFTIDKFKNLKKIDFQEDVSKIEYQGKTPADLTPTEAFLVANYLLEQSENYVKESKGEMKTSIGIVQTMHARNTKKGELHIQEISTYSSMMKQAAYYEFKAGDDIHLIDGKPTNDLIEGVDWGEEYLCYTYEEFTEVLGRNPTDECPYIISSKTVLDSSLTIDEKGNYSFWIKLDPFFSTFTYVNEIAFIVNTDKNTISFASAEIKFTLDKNFKFLSEETIETFDLKYAGIPVTINANYTINFDY